MSKANVEKVRDLVTSDPALQQRLQGVSNERTFVETLIGIGKEKGLTFSEADLKDFQAQQRASEELSDEQLKTVAAGGLSYGDSIFCGFCGKTSASFYLPK